MENALRSRPRDEAEQKEQEIKQLKQKVGELVMDLGIDVGKESIAVALLGAVKLIRVTSITI